MESCPTEILSHIFITACTDGGQTSSALRLVSKRISTQVKPYQFRSVYVSGVPRTKYLIRTLSKVPVSQRRVKHLFISDKPGIRSESGLGVHYCWHDAGPRRFFEHMIAPMDGDSDPRNRDSAAEAAERERQVADYNDTLAFTTLFSRLLGLVNTQLQSLTLVIYDYFWEPKWIDRLRYRKFPQLGHLAIYTERQDDVIPSRPVQMPALRSLTLGGTHRQLLNWSSWITYFKESCNTINTLTIYGLTIDWSTRLQLRDLRGLPGPRDVGPLPLISTSHTPSTLAWRRTMDDDETHQFMLVLCRIPNLRLTQIVVPKKNYVCDMSEWLEFRAQELRADGFKHVSCGTLATELGNYEVLKSSWESEVMEEEARLVMS